MREANDKKGYTTVDHITFDLILPMLSTAAQSVFLRVYRQTAGWHKLKDKISLSQFRKYTAIKHNDTVIKAIRELETNGLLKVSGKATHIREYEIVWNRITEITGYDPLAEIDPLV